MAVTERLDRLAANIERHRDAIPRGEPIRRVVENLYADLAELVGVVRTEIARDPRDGSGYAVVDANVLVDSREAYR